MDIISNKPTVFYSFDRINWDILEEYVCVDDFKPIYIVTDTSFNSQWWLAFGPKKNYLVAWLSSNNVLKLPQGTKISTITPSPNYYQPRAGEATNPDSKPIMDGVFVYLSGHPH